MQRLLVAYVPVIHRGYLELFGRHTDVQTVYIFGEEILQVLGQPQREIRALDAPTVCTLVRSLAVFSDVQELAMRHVADLVRSHVIVPDDALTRLFAERYLASASLEHDTAFLRWDEAHVFSQQPAAPSTTSNDPFDRQMMDRATGIGTQSSDWWRRVGSVAVKDGTIVLESHNQHLPTEQAPYINGDPRDVIQAGQHSGLCSSIHSEQAIIAEAARVALGGADVYVTTFPCPVCAKLLAHAGVRRLFFRSGHASLDGREVLERYGVEVIHVPG